VAPSERVIVYAFDLLEPDGDDLHALSLGDRKTRPARLLARRRVSIVLSETYRRRRGYDLPAGVPHEPGGITSKKLPAAYRSRPSPDCIKVKNSDSPAMIRAREAECGIHDGNW
jgi:ATP-dependent DNA ligase